MRTTEARVLFTPEKEEDRFLPEGPRCYPTGAFNRQTALCWVNIQSRPDPECGDPPVRCGSFFVANLDEDSPPRNFGGGSSSMGFILPGVGKHHLLAGERSLIFVGLGHRGSAQILARIPDDNPRTIINDAEVVPGGKAVVFGTKDVQFKDPIAHLYLYTVDDNRVSVLADKQICSNGKVFRTDDRGLILFDIDTPKRNVVRYRLNVAARTATPDGVALDLAGEPGFPDGMCDCGDGTVIIAFYNPEPVVAGRAVRFDLATGEAVEEWTTPGSPRVTCPLLVKRPDGVKLILTTATEGMPAEQRAKCPNAGCLFIADTTLASCPEPELVRLP